MISFCSMFVSKREQIGNTCFPVPRSFVINVMTSKFEYRAITTSEEVKQLGKILDQCFIGSSGDEEETYIQTIGAENYRLIRHDKQIIGGLATIPLGQWWGGQCVSMTGIGGVGIAPEHRGNGVALSMMQHTLKEIYASGVPISVLYPAAQKLYRKLGYEQAGSRCIWEIPTESIQVKEKPLSVIPIPNDSEILYELYRKQAGLINGYLDRSPAIWKFVFRPDGKEVFYSYLIGSMEKPQGYIIFSQHRTGDGSILLVEDWVVLTPAAAHTFWSFLFSHRSQIDKIRWRGSVVDPLTLLLPEQATKLKLSERWMLRIVDAVKALSLRGYPLGIETELHLEIQDDLIPENNRKFILCVTDGCGTVTKGGKGELQLDIRGLAPLYSGLYSPQQLQLAGKLSATETAIFAATQIFAGVSPWMPDFF